eukprot:COSAG05_NODE_6711_length_916_cov_3.707466_1_plen_105_part_10
MSRFPECPILCCGLGEFLEIDPFSVFLKPCSCAHHYSTAVAVLGGTYLQPHSPKLREYSRILFCVSEHGDYLFMHVRALCLLGESSTDVTAAATADGNGEYYSAC